MAITSLNFIINQLESENRRYFIIYDEENDPVFVQNDLLDQGTAIAKLKLFFKENSGFFTIKVFDKKLTNPKSRIDQDKSLVAKYNVEISQNLNAYNPVNGTNPGMFGINPINPSGLLPADDPRANAPNIFGLVGQIGEMNSNLKLMEKDHQHYIVTKELQERISKLEEERNKQSGMAGVLGSISEQFKDPAVIMGLLSNIGGLFKSPSPMPMNGVEDSSERKNIMVQSINSLMELDNEFPENIAFICNLAKSDLKKYQTLISKFK